MRRFGGGSANIRQRFGEGSANVRQKFGAECSAPDSASGIRLKTRAKRNFKMVMAKRSKRALEMGASLAALAATAAAVYVLAESKKGKNMKAWYRGLKRDVVKNLSKTKTASREAYHGAVDAAAKKYAAIKNIDRNELQEGIRQLKGHWDAIRSEINKAAVGADKLRAAIRARRSKTAGSRSAGKINGARRRNRAGKINGAGRSKKHSAVSARGKILRKNSGTHSARGANRKRAGGIRRAGR